MSKKFSVQLVINNIQRVYEPVEVIAPDKFSAVQKAMAEKNIDELDYKDIYSEVSYEVEDKQE